ncbi:MAG: hypothetical protein M1837_007170 [Sclerophora amabilis]|nr:MAG: hypothetical protein M1837_007170 [Sclerophora amabilis]
MDSNDSAKATNQEPSNSRFSDNLGSESNTGSSITQDIQSEGWEDIEPQEIQEQFVCFYNDETFPNLKTLLAHCKASHNLDVVKIRRELGLDFYGTIRLVNYLRSEIRDGNPGPQVSWKEPFSQDKYLQPVLEDDAVLFSLDEIHEDEAVSQTESPAALNQKSQEDPLRRISDLEEQLQRLQSQFDNYKLTVKNTLNERLDGPDERPNQPPTTANLQAGGPEKSKDVPDNDSHYFTSYSYNEIHEIMLKDTVRTDSYRDFIYDNKNLFHGKTVLDVGCGTGILSMLCAKAGAKKVIAVDNSEIINKARENVFENGLDEIVTCLSGKIEEVALPVEQVDIIVSEWMGYCLLYEAMLDSVLWARDRYLSPTGLMVPSHTTLRLAPLADPDYISSHISFWHSVYGFSMTSMLAKIYDDVLAQSTASNTLAGASSPFLHLNLYTAKTSDLTFTAPFTSTISEDIDALDGWVVWFDTFFLPSRQDVLPPDARAEEWTKHGGKGVAFTTGPGGPDTHWRQGVLLIDHGKKQPQPLKRGDTIKGTISYKKPEENSRELDVEMTWAVENRGVDNDEGKKQKWRL